MKDELHEKLMTKLAGLKPKTFSYLLNDYTEQKATGTENCIIKPKHKNNNKTKNNVCKIIKMY